MSALIFNIVSWMHQKDKKKMKTWEGRLVCMYGSHHEREHGNRSVAALGWILRTMKGQDSHIRS